MNTKNDAFGQTLLDQYKDPKRSVREIVERDDNFIGADPAKYYFTTYKDWSKLEKDGLKFVRGKVLDIGCGAGRHALYLQSKGFDVTGIDNSPLAIKVSKLRGLKKAKVLPIQDVNKFPANSFDTVIMMFNNFGLFGSPRKAKQTLKKLYRITSKDAQIIAETRNPYDTNDPDHTSYHQFNRNRGRLGGQLRIRIRYGKLVGSWLDYWLISPKELKDLIKDTNWKIKRLLSDNNGYTMVLVKRH